MSLESDVNNILDTRKVQKLIDDNILTDRELAESPIVFVCECGSEQDIDNTVCERCKRPI